MNDRDFLRFLVYISFPFLLAAFAAVLIIKVVGE